jgi:hypothetical protein
MNFVTAVVLLMTLAVNAAWGALQSEIKRLTIPWPAGIEIDKVTDSEGRTYRFGRLQHNSIGLRPQLRPVSTVDAVFTGEECEAIVARADAHAAEFGWSKGRHVDYDIRPTSDLPVEALYSSTEEFAWLHKRFAEKLWPVLADVYGIDASKIKPTDLFITKYNASTNERFLAPHKDKSPWSFVIALNSDFEGGGTYFHNDQVTRQIHVGSAILFNGNQLHSANTITRGVRYIMAGFCDYGEVLPVDSPEAHAEFLAQYDPQYDGHAGQAGFRSGDQIIGIEVCEDEVTSNAGECVAAPESGSAQCKNTSRTGRVIRRRADITGFTGDSEWQDYAQSCERYDPRGNTVLWVRRKV